MQKTELYDRIGIGTEVCPVGGMNVNNYDVKQEVTDKFSLRGRVFHKLREDILNGKYEEHEELKEVTIGE